MLGAGVRVVLGTLLAVVMAGSAVAFALGVNFTPHASCTPSTGYGSTCPPKKYNLKHIHVKGFGQIRNCTKHEDLTFTNNNQVPIHGRLVVTIRTRSGKTVKITKTFTLGVGKKITVKNPEPGSNVASATLRLTVTDTTGDVAVITSGTIGKPAACVKAVSVTRPPAFTASAN